MEKKVINGLRNMAGTVYKEEVQFMISDLKWAA